MTGLDQSVKELAVDHSGRNVRSKDREGGFDVQQVYRNYWAILDSRD